MERIMTFDDKRDWLLRRGYVYNPMNNCFSITIAVKADKGVAHRQETITWDEISSMTKEQLEAHDARIWMKARREIAEIISGNM